MQAAGLILDHDVHHLDHLAPLCVLFQIPLILTEAQTVYLAQKWYPGLSVLHWKSESLSSNILENFDSIFYSIPRILFEEVFSQEQKNQLAEIRTIWCPHGNSDKGRHSPFMEGLKQEELILTYGSRIEAFLREKGVMAPFVRVGNYRFHYFKQHKQYYHDLIPQASAPIVLYAPTWQDDEQNSSFPNMWHHLLTAPSDMTLWVKLHPHLYRQYPEEINILREAGITFIEDCPAIYPLLDRCDLLIGDFSSICYDFLAFNKPLILLHSSPLTACGRYVLESELSHLFNICREELRSKTQTPHDLYLETYDVKPLDMTQLKEDLWLVIQG